MAGVLSNSQLGYVTLETTYGTIVAPANANAFRAISLSTRPSRQDNPRPDKNRALGRTIGVEGLRLGEWSMSASLAGSGTAGTAPDIGLFLQAALGKAPAVVAGTSVTYALDSTQYGLDIWNYWTPSNATQQVAMGAVVNSLRINASGQNAIVDVSGPCRWVLDTAHFSAIDSVAKGGLSAFPSEPSSPTTNGNQITLFAGSLTLDSNAVSEVQSFDITIGANRELPQDVIFNGQYAGEPGQGIRDITFNFTAYDKAGDTNWAALKSKAARGVAVDGTVVLGNVAGNICTLNLKNILLGVPQDNDGGLRKTVTFSGCRCNMTNTTSNDEMSIVFT